MAVEESRLQPGRNDPGPGTGPVVKGLSTVHLYYNDTELFSNTGRIIAVHEVESNGGKLMVLVADETVMHPQGGIALGIVFDS